jgi:hypothetical protein
MFTAEQTAALDQVKAGMDAQEAALRALPTDAFVIVWGDHALRTDGTRMGLLGPKVWHTADRADAEATAERFRDTLRAQPLTKDSPRTVVVVFASTAYFNLRAANENLIETVEAAMAEHNAKPV